MNKAFYKKTESHMLSVMSDAAHDATHVYRVLYTAVEIASYESGVDMEILLTACLLHDIGRELQFKDPSLCHAREGGRMACSWLMENGWDESRAALVRDCIITHRYRSDNPPASIEAKILFDADKLDVTGAIGVARTLFYQAHTGAPLYDFDESGDILTESDGESRTFFHEYNFKLRKIYSGFYTARGKEMALQREKAAADYYESLLREARESHGKGKTLLETVILCENKGVHKEP